MINTQFKDYSYFVYGQLDAYGQPILTAANGTIKMAINILNQQLKDNALYSDAQYIGLTYDANVNDEYIIAYGTEKLKVLYVNKLGRLNQVFMGRCAE